MNTRSLRSAFERIDRQLRSMYSLAYVSSNPSHKRDFRRIAVRPLNPDYRVRARPGYHVR